MPSALNLPRRRELLWNYTFPVPLDSYLGSLWKKVVKRKLEFWKVRKHIKKYEINEVGPPNTSEAAGKQEQIQRNWDICRLRLQKFELTTGNSYTRTQSESLNEGWSGCRRQPWGLEIINRYHFIAFHPFHSFKDRYRFSEFGGGIKKRKNEAMYSTTQ
jgi:hypothetical protein